MVLPVRVFTKLSGVVSRCMRSEPAVQWLQSDHSVLEERLYIHLHGAASSGSCIAGDQGQDDGQRRRYQRVHAAQCQAAASQDLSHVT